MTPMTHDLLLNLGRTTLTLTIAVLLIGILLRLARDGTQRASGRMFAGAGRRLVVVAVASARAVVRAGGR